MPLIGFDELPMRPQMRDDTGADQPARLDGDFQSTVPPQAEADVVGEVLVAVARVEHARDHRVNFDRTKSVYKARRLGDDYVPVRASIAWK